jgi:hypothetical protein
MYSSSLTRQCIRQPGAGLPVSRGWRPQNILLGAPLPRGLQDPPRWATAASLPGPARTAQPTCTTYLFCLLDKNTLLLFCSIFKNVLIQLHLFPRFRPIYARSSRVFQTPSSLPYPRSFLRLQPPHPTPGYVMFLPASVTARATPGHMLCAARCTGSYWRAGRGLRR